MENSNTIPVVSTISDYTFKKKYVNRNQPVIIKGIVENWAAIKLWDNQYFADNFPDSTVGVVPLSNGELDLNPTRGSKLEQLSIRESIKAVQSEKLDNGWAIASPIEKFPIEMQKQCPPVSYCASAKFLRGRVFIGPKGTVTPLHQDLFENLYTVVKGCKRIILYPPDSPVYRYSPFSKLPNHAQTDPEFPDFVRYPKFKEAKPIKFDLKAGETLFIPAFWWHHLRNLEPTIAVSYWWSQGWKLPIVWAASLYKKWRSI
jgi:hypothetical protein